jgi:hypothetical protein
MCSMYRRIQWGLAGRNIFCECVCVSVCVRLGGGRGVWGVVGGRVNMWMVCMVCNWVVSYQLLFTIFGVSHTRFSLRHAFSQSPWCPCCQMGVLALSI